MSNYYDDLMKNKDDEIASKKNERSAVTITAWILIVIFGLLLFLTVFFSLFKSSSKTGPIVIIFVVI